MTCNQETSRGKPNCYKRSLTYTNSCELCKAKNVNAVYIGETSRSIMERGLEHKKDGDSKKDTSHMWTHANQEHGGEVKFNLKVAKYHSSAFERQCAEAVAIKRRKQEGANVLNNKFEYTRCILPELCVELGNGKKISEKEDKNKEIEEKEEVKEEEESKEDSQDGTEWFRRGRGIEDTEDPTVNHNKRQKTIDGYKKNCSEEVEVLGPENSPDNNKIRDQIGPKIRDQIWPKNNKNHKKIIKLKNPKTNNNQTNNPNPITNYFCSG